MVGRNEEEELKGGRGGGRRLFILSIKVLHFVLNIAVHRIQIISDLKAYPVEDMIPATSKFRGTDIFYIGS